MSHPMRDLKDPPPAWASGPRRLRVRVRPRPQVQPEVVDIARGLVLGWFLLCMVAWFFLSMSCSASGENGKFEDQPVVLSPSGENDLDAVVTKWAARWAAATGRSVVVGAGGVPVTFEDKVWDVAAKGEPPHEVCGATNVLTRGEGGEWIGTLSVQISRNQSLDCPAWGYIVAHELGHAISNCTHTDDHMGWEEGALLSSSMSPSVGFEFKIDADSLEVVCSAVNCPTFTPEAP